MALLLLLLLLLLPLARLRASLVGTKRPGALLPDDDLVWGKRHGVGRRGRLSTTLPVHETRMRRLTIVCGPHPRGMGGPV
jgi:hypothetical protein